MNDDRTPNLLPVIQWLEAGCDPERAAAELRIYAERLAAAALSAAPAQEQVGEPLTLDQRYWLDRRGDIIAALEAEGLQIWSDKDRVWLHRLSASPLPQEPQEGKALTDERIEEVLSEAYRKLVREQGYSGGMGGATWDLAAARAIERELRGAQEVSASSKGEQR